MWQFQENLGKSWKITEPRPHRMESLATAGPTFSLTDAISAAVSCFGIDADAVRDPAPPKLEFASTAWR